MSQADKDRWDAVYAGREEEKIGAPCRVLAANPHLLPARGSALDLACGRGANAVYLAGKGYETFAWDISDVATQRLANDAKELELSIRVEQRDVATYPPPPASFDVIVVSRYLERIIAPDITAALREDGLLFYQTFTREKTSDLGPRDPVYRLRPNELLALFQPLHVIYYREEGTVGNAAEGTRNEAMLIAQKRTA